MCFASLWGVVNCSTLGVSEIRMNAEWAARVLASPGVKLLSTDIERDEEPEIRAALTALWQQMLMQPSANLRPVEADHPVLLATHDTRCPDIPLDTGSLPRVNKIYHRPRRATYIKKALPYGSLCLVHCVISKERNKSFYSEKDLLARFFFLFLIFLL